MITNVPYLGYGKQGQTLKSYCANYYPTSKSDLATVFIERLENFQSMGGLMLLLVLIIGYSYLPTKILESTY